MYTDAELDNLCLSFQVVYKDRFDGAHNVDLIPEGEHVSVNAKNAQQYIDLYVNWYLNLAIQEPFNSFYKGNRYSCRFP